MLEDLELGGMVLQDLSQPALPAGAGSEHKRGWFRLGSGMEYRKHVAFRRDNGMIGDGNKFELSRRLSQFTLPPMPPRELDLLHIIWLLFERQGKDPAEVNQVWCLCQSISRTSRKRHKKGSFIGKFPGIPGLHFRGRLSQFAVTACVLPCAHMWINKQLRFATGAEALQFQGIPVCPTWRTESDALLKHIAGNGFSLPVAAWYVLLGVVFVLRKTATGTSDRGAVSATHTSELQPKEAVLTTFTFASLAGVLVQTLLEKWPSCFAGCPASGVVRLGTLCSGGDFIVPMSGALIAEINAQFGMKIHVVQEFACEKDARVRAFAHRVAATAPGKCYSDCHTMPVHSMPFVDVLIFGSSCKSVSSQNNDRRDILDTDENDPKCSSGATMASCLRYVVERLPAVVIIENVMGMLRSTKTQPGVRNIQIVLDKLSCAGYVCGYDKQDSANWMLPQSRRRVYIWAHLPGFDACVWEQNIRLSKPRQRIPFELCLLERRT